MISEDFAENCNQTGLAGVSARLIKLAAPVICSHITKLCNLSLQTSQIPAEWKQNRVTPIHNVNNYRPISVMPTVMKILEKAVNMQLHDCLSDNNLLTPHQSGFRKGYSTNTVLAYLSNNLLANMEREPCPSSVVSGEFGTLTFPSTNVNQNAESEERCFDYVTYTYKRNPRATRRCRCDVSAVWEEPVLAVCLVFSEGEDINDLLRKISQAHVTAENVTHYSYDLLQAIEHVENATDINAEGLGAIAVALQKIAAVITSFEEVTTNVAQIVDNVLDVPNMEFVISDTNVGAPTKILDAFEQQITLFQTKGNGNNLTITGDNLAVVALHIPESSLDTGLGFGTVTSPSSEENDSASKYRIKTMVFFDRSDIPRAVLDASIALPSDVLNFVPPRIRESGTAPVTFLIFQNSKLFQSSALRSVRGNGGRLLAGTRVISATVEGAIIKALPKGREVETTFLELNVSQANETGDDRTCVFWEKIDDGGRWSSEGCRREDLPNVNRIRCLCNHLTSFAVLMDVSGDARQKVLDVLSMIGCIISIICLVITLVTYLGMKHLREEQPQKILINLCFSLLGLYLVFVVGIDRRNPTTGCVIIGFLIHFFLISSMSWMTVEAVNMYLLFVKVFNANVSNFMLKASLCAYGVPLVVCIVIVVVDSSLYLGDGSYCFVKPGPALYYGVLLIVAAILAVNFIIFGFVMQRLTCRRFAQGTSPADHREKWRRVQNAVAISVLLGLTWLFGFLAIEGARFLCNILFLIFNSLQGFFIFLMFCVRQEEVLDQWKQWIHCRFGKYVPEQHHKEKYAKKNSMTASPKDGPSSVEMSSKNESMLISSETLSTNESSVKI